MRFGIKTDYQPKKASLYSLSLDYVEEERGSAGYPKYPTIHAREYAQSFTPALGITLGRFRNNIHWGVYKQRSTDPDKGVDSSVRGWSLGENLSHNLTSGIFKDLSFGFAFKADHVSGSTITPYTEESYGVSLQKKFNFGKSGLNGSLGFRANLYSAFDAALNPELRLGYGLTRSVDLQFSITRTNNIPPILKRYYETSSTRANPDLGMERATNLSLSASYNPTETFRAGLTVFLNEITDRITYIRDLVGSGGMYHNFGKVTRKGTDLTIEWKPFQWLMVKPSHEFLIARDEETGLEVTASPRHRTQVSVHYKPVRQFTAVAIYEYESRQYTRSDNLEYADPYDLIELRADYAIGRWLLYGRIKNLANKTYLYGDGLPAPPRSWIGGLSFEF
jgi:iron complex outermembrane receptor protein